MRVPGHLVDKRRAELAGLLAKERYLPVTEICRRLGISEATARRDLSVLAGNQTIQRTFGGAVSFYNARFPSFQQRLQLNEKSKRSLAKAAMQSMQPGMTCFFDSGTTAYMLAEELRKCEFSPLTVVTANIPVAEMMAETPGADVHLIGGQLVVRQSVLLGPAARSALELWNFDVAVLSAEGMDEEGLWNSQEEIVMTQRTAISRAALSLALLDKSKLGVRTPHFLSPWIGNLQLITDAPLSKLQLAGIPDCAVHK